MGPRSEQSEQNLSKGIGHHFSRNFDARLAFIRAGRGDVRDAVCHDAVGNLEAGGQHARSRDGSNAFKARCWIDERSDVVCVQSFDDELADGKVRHVDQVRDRPGRSACLVADAEAVDHQFGYRSAGQVS